MTPTADVFDPAGLPLDPKRFHGTPGVYQLHFSSRIHPNRPTQNYVGWARDVERRVRDHLSGRSLARLPQVALEKGLEIHLVRVWEGADRNFERYLKDVGHQRKLCPTCTEGHPSIPNPPAGYEGRLGRSAPNRPRSILGPHHDADLPF